MDLGLHSALVRSVLWDHSKLQEREKQLSTINISNKWIVRASWFNKKFVSELTRILISGPFFFN
jgi:hypothetical protein